jgi:hypothetical protein
MPTQRQQQKEVKLSLFLAEVTANGQDEGGDTSVETVLVRAKSRRAARAIVADLRIKVRKPTQEELLSLGKVNVPVLVSG